MTKKARVFSLLLVLIAAVLVVARTSAVRADGPKPADLSSAGAGSVTQAPESPLVPVPLILDDGTAEDSIGLTAGGSFVWLNRFTPTAGQIPFVLQQVQVLFPSTTGCLVGDAIDMYVYTDADGNPANGATHIGSITGQTIQALDTWSTYPTNIIVGAGPDVLIAVVNRGCNLAGQFPAAIDQGASQGRSWVGFGAGATTNPPTFPTGTFGTIDSFGFPGNWMIRGLGDTNTSGPTPTPLPTATATATVTPPPAGTYCSTAPLTIPDNDPAGATQTINVPDSGALTDVNVYINATHTWVGDTKFTVTHNSASSDVIDRPGVPASTFGCSGDNINATLDDEAASPVENACAASTPTISGSFTPNTPLSVFDGMDRQGAWTITASDAAAGDTGTLNQWCLSFTPAGGPTPTATMPPATATTVPPTPTMPPTSVELGDFGSNESGLGGGWLISVLGLGLVALGLVAKRRR